MIFDTDSWLFLKPMANILKRVTLFFTMLLFWESFYAQTVKDTLFFINGTTVIGELKKVKLGVLTFDPDDANDITVQLRKVKRIEARSKIFRIETIQDKLIYGVLAKDHDPKIVNVIQTGDTTRMAVLDISNLYPFDRTFIQRFSGNIGLGYSYTRSSSFGRLNYDAGLSYSSKKEEIKLTISGIYTVADSGLTRDREDINLKYNYYLSPTTFATVFVGYQRNLELGLARRFQEGLGIGNKFITNRYIYAWARTGLAINQELSTEMESSGTLSEVFGQLQFNLFRFTKPEIDVNLYQSIFFGLTQKGRIRNDGELDLNWEIIDDLKLNLGFYTNYDNQPPVSTNRSFDYGMVIGLNYTF